jgi:hypothetical protein
MAESQALAKAKELYEERRRASGSSRKRTSAPSVARAHQDRTGRRPAPPRSPLRRSREAGPSSAGDDGSLQWNVPGLPVGAGGKLVLELHPGG